MLPVSDVQLPGDGTVREIVTLARPLPHSHLPVHALDRRANRGRRTRDRAPDRTGIRDATELRREAAARRV